MGGHISLMMLSPLHSRVLDGMKKQVECARRSRPISITPPSLLVSSFLLGVPSLTSLDRLQALRWNKPFPLQVDFSNEVYHSNRKLTKTPASFVEKDIFSSMCIFVVICQNSHACSCTGIYLGSFLHSYHLCVCLSTSIMLFLWPWFCSLEF